MIPSVKRIFGYQRDDERLYLVGFRKTVMPKTKLCDHGKRRTRCKACGTGFCDHGRDKYRCKDCGTGKCDHGKRKDLCKECSPTTFCIHARQKHSCIECVGASVCDHGKRRNVCKDCDGATICAHGKQKQFCKDCDGSQLCEHRRQNHHCVDCDGASICEHKKKRQQCNECKGSSMCEHNIQRSNCKACGGVNICPHDKQRHRCNVCDGASVCPLCKDHPDYRCGSKQYDGHCATCFKRAFPEDPRSKIIYEHTKEIRVRNAINMRFEGFVHDHALYTGDCDCTHRRRIDHRKLIGNTMLAIETDEFAHRKYDQEYEDIRYDDLYMLFSGKWIFIRFNPDSTASDKTDLDDRLDKLLETVDLQIRRIESEYNTELLEIFKLYY